MVWRSESHWISTRKLLGQPFPRLQEETRKTRPSSARERAAPNPFFFNMMEVFIIQIGNDTDGLNISNKDIVFPLILPNLEK